MSTFLHTLKHIHMLTRTQVHNRGVHVLVSGCLQPRLFCGWRHTTHQGIMGNNKYVYNVLPGLNLPTVLRRFVLWMGDNNYGMCSMSWDKLTHMTHLSLLALFLRFGDWNCRSGQSSQWAHCSRWDTHTLSLTQNKIRQSPCRFFKISTRQKVTEIAVWIVRKWGPVTKKSVCYLSRESVCACLYICVQGVSMCASPGRGE